MYRVCSCESGPPFMQTLDTLPANQSTHLLPFAGVRRAYCHSPWPHRSWPAVASCCPWHTLIRCSVAVPRLITVACWLTICWEGGNWGFIRTLSHQRRVAVPTCSRGCNSAPGRGSPWGCVWRPWPRLSCPCRSCSPADREACSWGHSVWPWPVRPCPSHGDTGVWHPLVPTKIVSWGSARQRLPVRCRCSSSHWWRQSGWGCTSPQWGVPVPVGPCPVRARSKVPSRPLPHWRAMPGLPPRGHGTPRGMSRSPVICGRRPAPELLYASIPGTESRYSGGRPVPALVPIWSLSSSIALAAANRGRQGPSTMSGCLQHNTDTAAALTESLHLKGARWRAAGQLLRVCFPGPSQHFNAWQ